MINANWKMTKLRREIKSAFKTGRRSNNTRLIYLFEYSYATFDPVTNIVLAV